MRNLFLFFIFIPTISNAQDYSFNGTMSREKLELYLSRAITMADLVSENSCYYPPCPVDANSIYNPTAYTENINMLADINARFIGRSCFLWGGEGNINGGYFNNVGTMVNDINSKYLQKGLVKPIVQAAIFEFVTNSVNYIQIPPNVAAAYGIPVRNFNFDYMKYNDFPSNANHITSYSNLNEICPDISKKETQMWFYYLAINYIDKGIEALHFGQVDLMDDNDANHQFYWDLLSKIRSYAFTKNRGVVICDAHTQGLYLNSSNQLLFDIHSYPIRIKEIAGTNWGTNTGGKAIIETGYCNGIYGKSKGGKTYWGWECTSLPYLVEFDNFDISTPNQSGTGCYYPWGWDEITWFALQTEDYRNKWLKYSYYKVKCLDKNGFLQMPGKRRLNEANAIWPGRCYRAATGYYNQQTTINEIWNNSYSSPSNWIHHNFTSEEVINQPTTHSVSNSLQIVETDKIYYIGDDGYIHGYIKDNGISGWHTVSPSYSAQTNGIPVNNQVKAKSNLIISPDKSFLLYIGTDGFIHGFNILSPWSYTYFDFVKQPMVSQGLRAFKNLIFAANNRIYYIAKENNGTGNARIHGFIKYNGSWVTVSPTYGSQVQSSAMTLVGGALTYSPINDRLYYVGNDGFLYYYSIINDWLYTYNIVPTSIFTNQNIRIMPEKISISSNSIFYIGKELTNNNALRIHELIDNNGTWITNSPSWAAQANQQPVSNQVQSNGLEISTDLSGSRLFYIGIDKKIYFYERLINNNSIYSYNYTYGSFDGIATNSLLPSNNSTLFYISDKLNNGDGRIHYIKLEESYCQNNLIQSVEPGYIYSRVSQLPKKEVSLPTFITPNKPTLKIFPTPVKGILKINNSSNQSFSNCEFTILSIDGKVISRGVLINNSINCTRLTSGMYILSLADIQKKEFYRIKFVAE